MRKVRNGFVKNLNYLCLVGVIALGLMTIVATGGGGGDGGVAENPQFVALTTFQSASVVVGQPDFSSTRITRVELRGLIPLTVLSVTHLSITAYFIFMTMITTGSWALILFRRRITRAPTLCSGSLILLPQLGETPQTR